ncbi:vegetative cell wall protein gp1-like [Iris pallida]|uniref:Vegetative cell wall protein gp1-like n=1 Tax=Iris pallida TaxID=29817 RepID=A0AAX6DRZ7_IRIPA|nr:vegetative cell wall protein gp1-like [Iris pallida]
MPTGGATLDGKRTRASDLRRGAARMRATSVAQALGRLCTRSGGWESRGTRDGGATLRRGVGASLEGVRVLASMVLWCCFCRRFYGLVVVWY